MVRGRKKDPQDMEVVSFRIPRRLMEVIRDIAQLETITIGKPIYSQKLMREALDYVFTDNERLRDCFRRSRISSARKFQQRS